MAIKNLHVAGYRSVREVRLKLSQVNVLVWITTHSQPLAEAIRQESGISPIRLEKVQGETRVIYSDESEPD